MAIYIGEVIVDPSVVMKLNTKHQVTVSEVRKALLWPARVEVALEDHPVHGLRWIALAETAEHRRLLAWLLPAPAWAGELAEDWVVKSARWL